MIENIASGVDADISRNIELYDLSLRAVASNLVMPEIRGVREMGERRPESGTLAVHD